MADRRPSFSTKPNTFRDYNRAHIPERNPDENVTQKIFLLIEEGDIFKLKDFMLTNKATVNARLETGETLLHMVLNSSNLSKGQKYELSKFLIEHGAPVGLSDAMNITPLHIACKLQLVDVINLLLKHGAITNVADNNGMTPLHYQIMSENSTCKTDRSTKIGDFNVPTITKEKYTAQVKNMNNTILDILYQNDDVNKYMVHIQKTIKNLENMYPEELDTIQEKFTDSVTSTITNSDTPNLFEKSDKIFNLTVGCKNDINIMVSNKLKESLVQTNIKPNTIDGWGPSNNQMDQILPYSNINKVAFAISHDIRQTRNSVSTKLRQHLGNIDERAGQLSEFTKKWETLLTEVNKRTFEIKKKNANSEYVTNVIKAENITNLFKGRDVFNQGERIKIPALNLNQAGNYNLAASSPGVTIIKDGNAPGNRITNDLNNGYYFISLSKFYLELFKINMKNIKNNNETLIKFMESSCTYATYEYMCSNLSLLVINAILYLGAIMTEIDVTLIPRFKQILTANGSNTPNNTAVYTKIADDTTKEINNLANIKTIINDMYKMFYNFMDTLNSAVNVINMLSAARYMRQYHNEYIDNNKVTPSTDILREIYYRAFQPLPMIPPTFDEFRSRIASIDYNNIKNPDILAEMKKKLFELYIPQITYKNYSCYYAQNTAERPGDKIKIFDNENNLVDSNLEFFGIGKITLPDGTVQNESKNILRWPTTKVNGCARLGYLLNIENGMVNTEFNIRPIEEFPALRYGHKVSYYTDVPNPELDPGSPMNRIGLVNIKPSVNQNKKEAAAPIIGTLLDKHLYMIKYLVIQIYLNNCKIILEDIRANRSTTGNSPIMIKFRKEIENYINSYKDELSMNELHDYIIYVLVARIVDTALINFIKGCINSSSIYHTIKVLNQFNNKPEYAQILQDIKNQHGIDNIKVNLMNMETNFKIDLNGIIDDVYTKFLVPVARNTARKVYELNYTDLLVKDKNPDDTSSSQHIVYNYSYNTKLLESRCYKINAEIIDILVKNNAQVNYKNINGNTPLYYAIENQHIETIKKLLSYNVSVNTNLSRNVIGITPLQHALNMYSYHLEILKDTSSLTSGIYKKIEDLIRKKPEYKNNVIKYADNILPQIMLMMNHHFYLLTKQYKKDWTYDKYKLLMDKFASYNIIDPESPINKTIPLLTYFYNLTLTGTYGTQALTGRDQFIDVQLAVKNNKLDEFNQRVQSINDEYNDIIGKVSDPYYQARINELRQLSRELTTDINNIRTDITKLTNLKKKVQTTFNVLNQQYEIKNIKTRIDNFNPSNIKNSVQLYDKIFTNVINYVPPRHSFKYMNTTNLDTYRSLWSLYIADIDGQNNLTNLPILLTKFQLILLEKFNNKEIDLNEYNQSLELVFELHKNIINPFAEDYETLPLEYNTGTNYALDIVMDILIHVIKYNLCSMLCNVLTKSLTLYVMNVNNKTAIYTNDIEYSKYITGIVDNIMSSGSQHESMIIKYIMTTLPLRCVKIITKIYEGDDDPDRLLVKISSLFDPITNMLIMNQTLPIDTTSSIITLMDKTIYPYFTDIIEQFVKEGKNMIDSYLRYSLNESKQVEIIKLLSDKAKNETTVS